MVHSTYIAIQKNLVEQVWNIEHRVNIIFHY
jgi:hypothetical protein